MVTGWLWRYWAVRLSTAVTWHRPYLPTACTTSTLFPAPHRQPRLGGVWRGRGSDGCGSGPRRPATAPVSAQHSSGRAHRHCTGSVCTRTTPPRLAKTLPLQGHPSGQYRAHNGDTPQHVLHRHASVLCGLFVQHPLSEGQHSSRHARGARKSLRNTAAQQACVLHSRTRTGDCCKWTDENPSTAHRAMAERLNVSTQMPASPHARVCPGACTPDTGLSHVCPASADTKHSCQRRREWDISWQSHRAAGVLSVHSDESG
jgi:hypothetical protein